MEPDFDWVDDEELVDALIVGDTPVDLNLSTVNGMLAGLRKATARITEYLDLDRQERARLDTRKWDVLGPLERRQTWLHDQIKAFQLAAWRREKRGSFALPNGTLKSSAVLDKIAVTDEAAAWLEAHDPETVIWKPQIVMGPTRKLLLRLEKEGVVKRVIDFPADGKATVIDFPADGKATVIEAGEVYTGIMPDGGEGRWAIVDDGVPGGELVELVPGLTWSTNGDEGIGRNFKVEV